jgi:hypothetical protein
MCGPTVMHKLASINSTYRYNDLLAGRVYLNKKIRKIIPPGFAKLENLANYFVSWLIKLVDLIVYMPVHSLVLVTILNMLDDSSIGRLKDDRVQK